MKTTGNKIGIKALFVGSALLFAACGQDRATTEVETTTTTTDETMTDMRDDGEMRDTMGAGMKSGMMAHMHDHMGEMREMRTKMTGDPDHDFAQMMAVHHEGAIRMAEEEVASGTDTKLKEIANRTITRNKTEVDQLQKFIGSHKPTTGDTTATMRMMQPMNKMMADMHQKDMPMAANTDQSFAQMMVHHHQSGIDMSREFMKMAKTPDMKKMAQQMMDEQQKDMKELQAWQQQNKK